MLCKCGKHGPSDPSDADFKPVFEMLPPRGIVTLSDAR